MGLLHDFSRLQTIVGFRNKSFFFFSLLKDYIHGAPANNKIHDNIDTLATTSDRSPYIRTISVRCLS